MKRLWSVAAGVLLCLSLCGCSLFGDTSELLKTPRLTGEMYSVEQALRDSVRGGYSLEYPSLGEKRSSIILEDIDGDSGKEAIAFYSQTDKEEKHMHLTLLVENRKEYKTASDFSVTAAAVERIELCDFNGDGKKEIVAGFDIYGNTEKTFVAFKYNSGKLIELMRGEYTSFLCCDLLNNGKNQLLVQKLAEKDSKNTATLYSLEGKTFSKVSSCALDGTVTSVSKTVFSSLSNGNPAVYIDEIKGVGAITEVLVISKGALSNPLYATNNESGKTIRSAGIPFFDINGDSVLEIPITANDPEATASGVNHINWCSFNGEKLTVRQTAFINVVDGYSLVIPSRLVGKIKVTKNTDKRLRTVYYTEKDTDKPERKIMTVRVVPEDSSDKVSGETVAVKNGERFVMEYSDAAEELKITKKELKAMFCFNDF